MAVDELEELLVAIQVEFPEICHTIEIGNTYEGNPINAYVLLDSPLLLTIGQFSEQGILDEIQSRPGLLMNGAHHARELTTISMVMYTMLRVLHGYVHEDDFYQILLKEKSLFFIPAVNYDGFAYISEAFDRTGKLEYIRKNRHIYKEMNPCTAEM